MKAKIDAILAEIDGLKDLKEQEEILRQVRLCRLQLPQLLNLKQEKL